MKVDVKVTLTYERQLDSEDLYKADDGEDEEPNSPDAVIARFKQNLDDGTNELSEEVINNDVEVKVEKAIAR